MARTVSFTTEEVAASRAALTAPKVDAKEWTVSFRTFTTRVPATPRALMDYHDLLLFLRAFPRDPAHPRLADEGLARVERLVHDMAARNAAYRFAFANSGIAGARSFAYYSIDLARWLTRLPGAGHVLDALDGEEDTVRHVLLATAVGAERDAVDDARTAVIDRLDANDALRDLVDRIDRASPSPDVRNALWEACAVNIRAERSHPQLTRTWCRADLGLPHVFSEGYRAPVDVAAMCERPLEKAISLSVSARATIITAARGALIGYLRETDTATLCDPSVVELHDMGFGITVALLTLPPGRRTPFDAYVGYVAFANGVPVAYGGAWIFPGKSKVGINVFPSFRGGPSFLVFASILRCYAQRYAVGCFEADNYQLGHGNADGIRSGAYWFYYRAGFRTVDPTLARIAVEERARMDRDRTYRTTAPVLRKLASQPMRLVLHAEDAPVFELVDLSDAVFRGLSGTGDRAAAVAHCAAVVKRALGVRDMAAWSAEERQAFNDLAPALAWIPDLERWRPAEKKRLVTLVRAKAAATEARYVATLRRSKRLLDAWAALANADQASDPFAPLCLGLRV